ncbi:hypothetical protein KXD93_23435 [Mucilaginibacter sp. BJC16-A38]|uniref:hypothetical protein n=1 Tax=Mucilaginibacter phenanthrenivorans TaxID=1234842 RepID=UPI00215701AB|nr:hypothetical protein [Mucilaginibacter phenanthrenivorans]MCR8560628.1 hypothetical protein [Mucilaginibacter phenanthrenivorans]
MNNLRTNLLASNQLLTREEMKNVKGGKVVPYNCFCEDDLVGCGYWLPEDSDGYVDNKDILWAMNDCCGSNQKAICDGPAA